MFDEVDINNNLSIVIIMIILAIFMQILSLYSNNSNVIMKIIVAIFTRWSHCINTSNVIIK